MAYSYSLPSVGRSGPVTASYSPSSQSATIASRNLVGASYAPSTTIGSSGLVGTSYAPSATIASGTYGASPQFRSGTPSATIASGTYGASPQFRSGTYANSALMGTGYDTWGGSFASAAPVTTFAAAPQAAYNNFAGVQQGRVISTAPTFIAGAVSTLPTMTVMPTTITAEPLPAEVIAEPLPEDPMVLTYWPLFAKGVAPAVALTVGGFDWALGAGPGSQGGDLMQEWAEMKPNTQWGFLPNLEVGGGAKIGSELAILQFLARKSEALNGFNDSDIRISQELLHQAEELYQKLVAKVPTIIAPDKSPEDFETFWTSTDRTTHSMLQGLPVYLTQFEEFYAQNGGQPGQFTTSGRTIGEIKLYATLAVVLLVDNSALTDYPGLLEFYMRWDSDPQVKDLLDTAMSQWGWSQYFIPPQVPEQA